MLDVITRGALLRLRGILVGTTSGVVSLGAHFAGGGAVPDGSTATAVVAACGAVGAWSAALHGNRLSAALLASLLVGGQVAGHIALSITAEHGHHLVPSSAMLAVHAIGVAVALLLVRGVENAGLALAHRVLRFLPLSAGLRAPAPPTTVSIPAYRSPLRHWLRVGAGTGTRAPPRVA